MQKVAPPTVNDGRFSVIDGTFWLFNWTPNRASQSCLGLGTTDRAPNRAPQLLHMRRASKGALSLADGLPSSDMDLVDDPSPKYPLSHAPSACISFKKSVRVLTVSLSGPGTEMGRSLVCIVLAQSCD
jgi:hypothetical protein